MTRKYLMRRFLSWGAGPIAAAAILSGLLMPIGGRAGAFGADALRSEFANPPLLYKSRPLWFWNDLPDAAKTRRMMSACKSAGYAGLAILPAENIGLGFMTPEFLGQYRIAVDEAGKLGLKMSLYDEYWFPSGSAGGLLARKFPEALCQRLDMLAVDLTGPLEFSRPVPPGTFMGAVAMDAASKARTDISASAKNGQLTWSVPAGAWKVMIFTCVRDGARDLVDYLDPAAVARFVELTYQAYYDAFPAAFGPTIETAFYDEPTFYWVKGGRMWTGSFNARYRERFGSDPTILYPALWFDIGAETAAARNALFGFRAELYATGFPKVLDDWCRAHGIQLTGHVDQEEIVSPVGLCGDLIKAFRHQAIPGIDAIFNYGRGSEAYKVVSSAASNYDRPQVVTECYGATRDMPVANLYKEAMDQFAKGINTMVPHGVWYNGADLQPDLTPGAARFGPELPRYNDYIGRLQRMLQGGRHVADIGVLYPIATLQAGYFFDSGQAPNSGGIIPSEADYLHVGECLALGARRDFTFVHPETLDERCTVEGGEIRLQNPVNWERYKVFIVPGSRTISAANLRKIKAFYDQGGQVIATTRLPDFAAEFGKDAEVRSLVAAIFGEAAGAAVRNKNGNGGRSWFIPTPDSAALRSVLDEALPDGDVVFEVDASASAALPTYSLKKRDGRGRVVQGEPERGNLSYIHKVKDGRTMVFIANSSDRAVDVAVRLRGRLAPELWDPHDGTIRPSDSAQVPGASGPVTRVRVKLPPVRSVLLVAAEAGPAGGNRP
jgi:hypothetical protein